MVLLVFALSSGVIARPHALSQSCADVPIIDPTGDGTCSKNDTKALRKRQHQPENDKAVIHDRQVGIKAIANEPESMIERAFNKTARHAVLGWVYMR